LAWDYLICIINASFACYAITTTATKKPVKQPVTLHFMHNQTKTDIVDASLINFLTVKK